MIFSVVKVRSSAWITTRSRLSTLSMAITAYRKNRDQPQFRDSRDNSKLTTLFLTLSPCRCQHPAKSSTNQTPKPKPNPVPNSPNNPKNNPIHQQSSQQSKTKPKTSHHRSSNSANYKTNYSSSWKLILIALFRLWSRRVSLRWISWAFRRSGSLGLGTSGFVCFWGGISYRWVGIGGLFVEGKEVFRSRLLNHKDSNHKKSGLRCQCKSTKMQDQSINHKIQEAKYLKWRKDDWESIHYYYALIAKLKAYN